MVHLQTFSSLRYAQCWEDADILLEGLDINNHDVCLSIASAGDNTLAMLAKNPKRVIAIDLNPTQIACLDLRVSAYQHLSYQELLEFMVTFARREPGFVKAQVLTQQVGPDTTRRLVGHLDTVL